MIQTRTTRLAASLLALALAAVSPARASDAATEERSTTVAAATTLVIDASFGVRVVELITMDDGSMVVLDALGRRVRETLDDVVALLPVAGAVDSRHGVGAVTAGAVRGELSVDRIRARLDAQSKGFLQLTSGARYPGEPVDTAGDPERLAWAHPRLGAIHVALDDVSAALFTGDGAARWGVEFGPPPTEDVLFLTNGDRMTGFLMGLGDPAELETADGVVPIERALIEGLRLANDPADLRGAVVWLDDGTIATVDTIAMRSPGEIQLALAAGQIATYSVERLRAIAFETERLVPLAWLEPTAQDAIGDRYSVDPIILREHPDDVLAGASVALGARDIELPGPMRVEYRIPRDVTRFAATAALAPDAAPWGDCELVVLVDGREVLRARLSQDNPARAINLPLDGRTLEIRVEPGRYGPIQDRVVLHRPLLLRGR